jgi:GrpB-like predicted nucleotidyltransferase (UPF0157 family)
MTGTENERLLHKVVPYADDWPYRFRQLAALLLEEVPGALDVEHIGSTAVPGMQGRDILDVELLVESVADEESYEAPLRRLGFRRFSPQHIAGLDLRVFVPADGSGRVHLHVCEEGSPQHRRHVAVRDYLRQHPEVARQYEAVKREAALAADGDRASYSRGKGGFVQDLEAEALRWQGESCEG